MEPFSLWSRTFDLLLKYYQRASQKARVRVNACVSMMSSRRRYEDMGCVDVSDNPEGEGLGLDQAKSSSKLVGIQGFSESAAAYGIYRWRGSLESGRPVVLFQDCNNLWAPLYNLYWSSSSQQLVSKHPLSCIEEGISAYCPQCLCRYTEDETIALYSRCKFCYYCPQCSCILSPVKECETSCSLFCNNCLWKPAEELLLVAKDKAELADIILKKERCVEMSNEFDQIITHFKSITDESIHNSKSRQINLAGKLRSADKWTIQDLEASLHIKENLVSVFKGVEHSDGDIHIPKPIEKAVQEIINENVFTPLSYRDERIEPCMFISNAIPLRVRLLSTRTVRCRRDVDSGQLSILVQPKLFPLEGDSSQKVFKGKWWVKDSSAIHEIPSIYIIRLPSTSFNRINLRIENLKEVACNLTFSPRCCTDSTHTCNVFESPNLPLDPSVFSNVDIPAASAPPTIRLEAWQDELLRDGATTAALSGTIAPASEGPEHTAELIRAFDGFNKLDFINSGKSEFIVFDSTCKVSIPLLRLEKNAFYQIKLQVKVEDVTEIITTKLINLVIAFTVT